MRTVATVIASHPSPPTEPVAHELPAPAAAQLARISAAIGPQTRLGVAFSGGVDSTVLLASAARSLGAGRVLAILGVSASLAADERQQAHDVAEFVGTPLVELRTQEGDNASYRANGPDRCFFCKEELFSRISTEIVRRYGLSALAYGENADDARRPDRPGASAAAGHSVLRPLADAGLDKTAVRELARALGLPNADKPAAPCLASRIPHFEEVTPEKLQQVEAAEAALRDLGFPESRVRHHGEVARIELPAGDLPRATTEAVRPRLLAAVRAAGFRFVTLDLAGIQSGAFTLPLVVGEATRLPDPAPRGRPATAPAPDREPGWTVPHHPGADQSLLTTTTQPSHGAR